MIGPAIVHIILSAPAIVAEIADRLRPMIDAAEGTPAIYYIIESRPGYTNNGPQMNKWKAVLITNTKYYNEAWNLSMLCKQEFDKYRRAQVGATGIKFVECVCTVLRDEYEFLIEGHGQLIEFEITTQNLTV